MWSMSAFLVTFIKCVLVTENVTYFWYVWKVLMIKMVSIFLQ